MAIMDDLLADASRRMDKSVDATAHELNTVRTGRASAALLDRINVEYYGQRTPLRQLATINVPDAGPGEAIVRVQACGVSQFLERQQPRIPPGEDDHTPCGTHGLPPVMTSRGLKVDVAASFSNSSRSSAVSVGGTTILSLTYRSPLPPP